MEVRHTYNDGFNSAGQAEYIVYRCPDGSLLLDWNETAWKFGYPAYPKHRCTEIERGYSEGGPALPKLYAAIKKKYLEEGDHDT